MTERTSFRNRLQLMREWFLSPECALCAQTAGRGRDLCHGCESALPALHGGCARCAAPLQEAAADIQICGECQQRTPAYLSVHAPFRYAAPVDRLVLGAKYGGRLDWIEFLGRRLASHVRERARTVDALLPVPLHRARLRERGYNQSLELARTIAKSLGLPLRRDLKRVRATPPQTALSREARRKNVRDAFAATGDLTGLRLALVDDVMTSGATVEAVTHCLLKAGAVGIEIWVVARA